MSTARQRDVQARGFLCSRHSLPGYLSCLLRDVLRVARPFEPLSLSLGTEESRDGTINANRNDAIYRHDFSSRSNVFRLFLTACLSEAATDAALLPFGCTPLSVIPVAIFSALFSSASMLHCIPCIILSRNRPRASYAQRDILALVPCACACARKLGYIRCARKRGWAVQRPA